jgi:hypothetical protein
VTPVVRVVQQLEVKSDGIMVWVARILSKNRNAHFHDGELAPITPLQKFQNLPLHHRYIGKGALNNLQMDVYPSAETDK